MRTNHGTHDNQSVRRCRLGISATAKWRGKPSSSQAKGPPERKGDVMAGSQGHADALACLAPRGSSNAKETSRVNGQLAGRRTDAICAAEAMRAVAASPPPHISGPGDVSSGRR